MKKLICLALLTYTSVNCNQFFSADTIYEAINPAQEKLRITLKQLQKTYTWLDTTYAARERFYLSGIALDYIRKQKEKFKTMKDTQAIFKQFEEVLLTLHVLDLEQKDFERIQCAAQPMLALNPKLSVPKSYVVA